MTTLMDTVRIEAPKRSPVKPTAPLDPPRDAAIELEVESRGGYRPTQWDLLAMRRGRPLWRGGGLTTLTDKVRSEAPSQTFSESALSEMLKRR